VEFDLNETIFVLQDQVVSILEHFHKA